MVEGKYVVMKVSKTRDVLEILTDLLGQMEILIENS